jgi:N-acetylneuraminic acid mutarotase
LLAFVAVSVVVAVRMLTGVGPNLPGEELGLISSEVQPCTLEPGQDLTPEDPQPAAGTWREERPLPEPRNEIRGSTVEGSILGVGAIELTTDGTRSSPELVGFDPAAGTYDSLPDAPIPVDHAVTVAYDGDLYLVGGASNGPPTNTMWRYSPARRQWEELAPMRLARYAAGGAVIGDRLYVVGGSAEEASNAYGSMEIYDFETGEWVEGPEMPTPRHHVGVAALDGKLYAAGGRDPGDLSLDRVERFDPETGEWEELPPLPQGTGGNAAVATEDELVVVAGGDDLGTGGIKPWVTAAVWAFDPGGEEWRRLPDLNVARHGHAAAVANDRIYVLGGAPCPDFGLTDSVESLRIR